MKTTKRRFLAAIAAISVLITALTLCGCDSDSPTGGAADVNSTSPAVEEDSFEDAGVVDVLDPGNEMPETEDSAVIRGAVVVSASLNKDTGRVTFACGAVLEGYPGSYTPFEFSVPEASVELTADEIGFGELAGKLVDIEFSGIFQDSYPMGVAGVTKVTYSGASAEQQAYETCNTLFDEIYEPEPEAEDSAVITDAVVVSASYNQDTGRVIFDCGAILEGYPGGYSPFGFSVPEASVELTTEEIEFSELAGKLIDIEFSGIFEESYPMGAAGVTKVTYRGAFAEQQAFENCKALFDELNSEPEPTEPDNQPEPGEPVADPESGEPANQTESCVLQGWIVDNAYIITAKELEGEKVSIIADAQLGTCGMKDRVEIILDKSKIKDEDGSPINPVDVEAGRCIEFTYTETSSTEQGSPVLCVIKDADYLTVRKDSVEVSEATVEALKGYYDN